MEFLSLRAAKKRGAENAPVLNRLQMHAKNAGEAHLFQLLLGADLVRVAATFLAAVLRSGRKPSIAPEAAECRQSQS